MEKYVVYTKPTKKIAQFPLFKVLSCDGKQMVIAGKSYRHERINSLYKINLEKYQSGDWVDLDTYLENCQIVGKKFFRKRPIVSTTKNGTVYEDWKFTSSHEHCTLLTVGDKFCLYCDEFTGKLKFLDNKYIDEDVVFDDVVNTEWTKDLIREKLVGPLERSLKVSLFDTFEK